MPQLLAIDTSSAWCSVALSLDHQDPILRHEEVSAGASRLLLPWIDEVLAQANQSLASLDAIAIGIGPGAFTGVRLGIAAVQGLALSTDLPVIPVVSLDAIAAQATKSAQFKEHDPQHFVVAIDARMEEIYWAKYRSNGMDCLPIRISEIQLSKPEDIDLDQVDYLAGSALKAYESRLFAQHSLPAKACDSSMTISALGILDYAKQLWAEGKQIPVTKLEPLYIRNKVALTTAEREAIFSQGVNGG
jgi:tRNA threonylcarbamoyladenosine biosynthesis protein TsaB